MPLSTKEKVFVKDIKSIIKDIKPELVFDKVYTYGLPEELRDGVLMLFNDIWGKEDVFVLLSDIPLADKYTYQEKIDFVSKMSGDEIVLHKKVKIIHDCEKEMVTSEAYLGYVNRQLMILMLMVSKEQLLA